MKILYEDNKNTPSSQLLISSCLGDYIDFAGGAPLLPSLIKKYKDEDFLIVYIDLVPNRMETINTYRNLRALIGTLNTEILLIPIICTEYSVLNTLVDGKYIDKSCVADGLLPPSNKNTLLDAASIEKRYKRALSDLGSLSFCFINSFKYDKDGQRKSLSHGAFYESSCPCGQTCRIHNINSSNWVAVSVQDKANQLYTHFPAFILPPMYKQKLGISCNNISIEAMQNERISFYNNLCDLLELPRLGKIF